MELIAGEIWDDAFAGEWDEPVKIAADQQIIGLEVNTYNDITGPI